MAAASGVGAVRLSAAARRGMAVVAGWMAVAAAFALGEGLLAAARSSQTFFFGHRLGSFTLARRGLPKLGLDSAWFAPYDHLWVPDAGGLVRMLAESYAVYGVMAWLGGLATAIAFGLLGRRLPAAVRMPLATAAAALAFGGAAIALEPLQGRNDYAVSHLAGGWPAVAARLAALAVVAVAVYALARWAARRPGWRRTAQASGLAALAAWLIAVAVTFAAPGGAVGGAVGGAPPGPVAERCSSRDNLVLVSMDTVRADHLSAYGYHRPTSPVLERLAADGVLFEHCVSASSWTIPSHASLFTSTYPSEHGAQDNFSRLPDDLPTLAEVLRAAGYTTLGVISAFNVSSTYGFDRGFVAFDDRMHGVQDRDAAFVTDRAIELLGALRSEPFFLFVHYFDAHTTYGPPPPYDRLFGDPGGEHGLVPTYAGLQRFARHDLAMPRAALDWVEALYDGEIRYVDDQLGRLLAFLEARGLRQRTVIAVTSDHGEEFEEHRSLFHRSTVYEELVHVPFVYAAPGGPAGVRVAPTVSSIDVAPTLLEALGCAVPATFRGRALARAAADGTVSAAPAFAETTEHLQRKAIVDGGYKLILSPYERSVELYSLADDPSERRNLAASERQVVSRLRQQLHGWFGPLRAARMARGSAAGRVVLDDEDRARLRALGYLN